MFIAGEDRPENGKYQCIVCGNIVTMDEETKELAPCPRCGETIFQAVH